MVHKVSRNRMNLKEVLVIVPDVKANHEKFKQKEMGKLHGISLE